MSKFELTMREIDQLLADGEQEPGEFDKLNDLLGTLTEEYEDLEEELEEAKSELEALQNEEPDLPDSLPGIEPIPYKTENLLDGELMEAFGKTLECLGPHAMLRKLDYLAKHIDQYNALK